MDSTFGAPPNPNELKNDEKMLALFSHLSLFVGGIILPIIFWATNKDKSKFVTFHSLQAIWFHVGYIFAIVFGVMFMVIGGFGMATLFGMSSVHTKSNSMPAIFVVLMVAFYGLLFLLIFAGIGYSIYMGIKAYHGECKKYPIVGNIIYKKVYGAN
jgi:uncharacterized Tic20 family protein